ncbi:MAG: single-stranded-DNA-specific exonuclease RecJ [Planctomycetota bacterium]
MPTPTAQTRWSLRSTELIGTRPLIDRVLGARGLDDPAQRDAVLNCSLLGLHNPERLLDADKACRRILDALAARETIAIYGDYDVDGITATATLYHTLKALDPNANVVTYVPHRLDEGYGLNDTAIRELAQDKNAGVIISVDCGITAVTPAKTARELGVDLIITDHHNPASDGSMPEPFALVHPRAPGSAYPFHELCGAGVAYKLAWRLAVLHADRRDGRASEPIRRLLLDLLAFTALGSIADVVPLVDENRVLTRFGMGRIKHSPFEGLRALVAASGLDSDKIDTDAVGFRLAPRLNACGRMGHAADAAELFTTATGERAHDLAAQLARQNTERQTTERRIVEQATQMAQDAGMTEPGTRAIVLKHADWHPGVVGIVCSRLVERFARPTLLLCDDGETAKGSGRSITGFNLHAGLDACAQHLTKYGGHDAAAGMALDSNNFDAFAHAFIDHTNSELTDDDLVTQLKADCVADASELTPDAVNQLDELRPFGRGNPKVRLTLESAAIDRDAAPFGAQAKHLGVHIRGEQGPALRCIAWNRGDDVPQMKRGRRVDLIITPKLSSWSGQVEPVIEDWRLAD